ncbi:triose-phosphate isomerase [Candidatus Kaiserbacteria bacterium]|nr:triose-phosphate isomerase [Candidatus Kaiserbacteria bacterium]
MVLSRATIRAMNALIVANWKMNPSTGKAAAQLFTATKEAIEKAKGVTLVVAPPVIYLREIVASYRGKRIAFAVQDARAETGGAHTGEISVTQAKDAGAAYVIVGHAERRAEGESDASVGERVVAALAARLTPVLCVGERERHPSGDHFTTVRNQLVAAFEDVPLAKASKVIIAYEPVWAIGAPHPMDPQLMHEMAIFIRKTLADFYSKPVAGPVLYGGAIDAETAAAMLQHGDVSGLLVGRASSDASALKELIRAVMLA